ncbi:hypothetical protein FB45DRAFT_1024224 [Roridomyces roridus]|uniref:Uncharacterized protein n=1 Tax=Roridomyces roridus TaxID=1738132 RepID=A0AAD7FVP1_9AGAR|nr:hypothetical protein FB45DRAFT_1024224 [Roridomyces roridus]
MSSTPTTPKAARSPSKTTGTGTVTPRKSPHCKTCGRPRKGHPLRACPVELATSDSEPGSSPGMIKKHTTTTTPTPATPRRSPTKTLPLIAALGALKLDDIDTLALEERDRQEKRARRKSAAAASMSPPVMRSLPSVSTVTGGILDGLTRLVGEGGEEGGEEEEDSSEKREGIVRWREGSGADLASPPNEPLDLDTATPTKKAHSKSKA